MIGDELLGRRWEIGCTASIVERKTKGESNPWLGFVDVRCRGRRFW
jgi:hypothetical protein